MLRACVDSAIHSYLCRSVRHTFILVRHSFGQIVILALIHSVVIPPPFSHSDDLVSHNG